MSRPRNNTVVLGVSLALVVGVIAAVVALTRSRVPDDAAFVYGDHVVTKDELNKRVDALRALYGIEAPKSAQGRDEFRRTAAKSYAVTLILDHEARARDITVSDKKARDFLDKFVDSEFGNRDAFIEALGNGGTSERAVLTEIRRQATTIELRKRIVGTVKISDAFLKSSFARRADELATPERRRLANVVVSSKQDATAVAARLTAGESVESLAAEVSLDESTRDAGGDLGYLAATDLEAPVAEAAFGVRKGQVYGPAKGSHGWNVGIVTGIRAPQPADFEAVRGQFRKQLQREHESAQWSAWLAKVIRAADVRYADTYRPAAPDAPPPTAQPTTRSTSEGAQ